MCQCGFCDDRMRSSFCDVNAIILTDSMSLFQKVEREMGSPDRLVPVFEICAFEDSCKPTCSVLDRPESK